MSAFVVNKEHIDALVTAGLSPELNGRSGLRWVRISEGGEREIVELTPENAGVTGAMLLAENQLSVNYRYDQERWEEPYLFEKLEGPVNPHVVLNACRGYTYQACEHEGWSTSEAHDFIESLIHACIKVLPDCQQASGWHISDRDVFIQAAALS